MARATNLFLFLTALAVAALPASSQRYQAILAGANEIPEKNNGTEAGVLLVDAFPTYILYNLTIGNVMDMLVSRPVSSTGSIKNCSCSRGPCRCSANPQA